MSSHSRLSPSASSRWLYCTASVQAIEDDIATGIIVIDPRPDSEANPAAYWGTQCHTISEMKLLGAMRSAINKKVPEAKTDTQMVETAELYVKYVKNLTRKGTVVLVEHRVGLGRWLPNEVINDKGEEEEQGGTADCILIHDDNTIDMIDLKGGMGMVYAEGNTQLRLYAAGILDEYELLADIKEIRVHIVQPRRDHYDVHSYEPSEIIKFMDEVAQKAASDIASGNTVFTPSEKACQWCERSGYCATQAQQISVDIVKDIDAMETESDQELEIMDAQKLTIKQLVKVQAKADEITAFLKSVGQRLLERGMTGAKTTGWKVVEANTNRRWGSSEDDISTVLGDMGLDEEDIWTTKLNTLSSIERKLNTKQKNQLAAHITKPSGLPTLVSTKDKRPSIKPMLTKQEMEEVKDNE